MALYNLIGQPSNCNLFRNLLFSNIFLANCRIISDMTQSTRRKYCKSNTALTEQQKTGPFCEFMQRRCKQILKIFHHLFVRCNWNEIKSNPPIDFVQSIQITKSGWHLKHCLLSGVHLFFSNKKKRQWKKNGRDFHFRKTNFRLSVKRFNLNSISTSSFVEDLDNAKHTKHSDIKYAE